MIKSALTQTLSELFNGKNLWLIPTFQRPYAWDVGIEAKRLFDDVIQANSRAISDYYISPIHVIEVSKDQAGKKLLEDYIDEDLGLDLDFITDKSSHTLLRGITESFKTYLIIDGQQRLLTSYIALFLAGRIQNITNGSSMHIPLVVPGSIEELAELKSQISSRVSLGGTSRAARKIANMFEAGAIPGHILNKTIGHYFASNVQLLRVVMDANAALGSFLTLNDRGKKLTTLETFKAHALYLLDIMDVKPTGITTKVLHNAFGSVYRSLDQDQSVLDDEKVVQMFGCSNIGNVTIKQTEAPGWGAQNWYDNYISIQSSVSSDWSNRLSAIADFNNHVIALKSSTTLPYVLANGRSINEEIEVAFDRFHPDHRVLTIVHLIIDKYKISLTDICGSIALDNRGLQTDLNTLISILRGKCLSPNLTLASQAHFSSWLTQISNDVDSVLPNETRNITLLQLAYMLNLIKVKPSQFITCIHNILNSKTLADALSSVEHYLRANKGRGYVLDFVYGWNNDRNSDAYRLVLDFEASKGRHWPISGQDEVEHIFAANGYSSLGNALAYGFSLQSQYDELVASIGNILPLEKRLNASIGKKAPIDKANYYISQSLVSGTSVLPLGMSAIAYSPSAVEVGNRLSCLGYDYAAHKLLVELRTLELAAFALKTL